MIYFSNKSLSQQLERAEGILNANFVSSHAKMDFHCGAKWIDHNGTYAMFDGADSPLTQTFGLGLFQTIAHSDLDLIEDFYHQLKAPVFHEISPMSDPSHMQLLNERNYKPLELTSVMFRPLKKEQFTPRALNPQMTTKLLMKGEEDLWAKISAEGWGAEMPELAEFMLNFGRIAARSEGAYPFLTELDGKPISTGLLHIANDIAVIAGDSTIPSGRNCGAQNALLDARLQFAISKGCSLVMMSALPGSQSQKNAEKNGFRIAYTRTKWVKS